MTIDVTGEDFRNQLIMSKHFNDDEWDEALEYYQVQTRCAAAWERTTIGFSIYEDDDLVDEVILYVNHRR